MSNKIYILLFIVLCIINYIKCVNTNSTIEKFTIKSFDSMEVITDCEYDSDCPRYGECVHHIYNRNGLNGRKYYSELGYCKIHFLCHKEGDCLSKYSRCLNNNDCENGICEYGICKNLLITKTCNEKSISDDSCKVNSLQKCKSNSDCFSNICKNNICITDSKNKIYRCGTEDNDVNGEDINISCKLSNEEECDSDDDCFSDNCSKGRCKIYKENYTWIFIALIVFFGLIVLFIVYVRFGSILRHRSRNISRN